MSDEGGLTAEEATSAYSDGWEREVSAKSMREFESIVKKVGINRS